MLGKCCNKINLLSILPLTSPGRGLRETGDLEFRRPQHRDDCPEHVGYPPIEGRGDPQAAVSRKLCDIIIAGHSLQAYVFALQIVFLSRR